MVSIVRMAVLPLAGLALLVAGCLSPSVLMSYDFYYSPDRDVALQERDDEPRQLRHTFIFDIDGLRLRGYLRHVKALMPPTLPALSKPLHSRYYLGVWREDSEDPRLRIGYVSVETPSGEVLFHSGSGESARSHDDCCPPPAGWHPAFTAEDSPNWYSRRGTSNNSWRYSRPVDIPWSCDEVVLNVGYVRSTEGAAHLSVTTGSVTLKHYHRTEYSGCTSSFSESGWRSAQQEPRARHREQVAIEN